MFCLLKLEVSHRETKCFVEFEFPCHLHLLVWQVMSLLGCQPFIKLWSVCCHATYCPLYFSQRGNSFSFIRWIIVSKSGSVFPIFFMNPFHNIWNRGFVEKSSLNKGWFSSYCTGEKKKHTCSHFHSEVDGAVSTVCMKRINGNAFRKNIPLFLMNWWISI